MRLITSGSGSGSLASYQNVVTLAAPSSRATRYRVEITLTALDVGHSLKIRETQGATVFINPACANNGASTYIVEVGRSLETGATSVVIAVIDDAGLSTSASWTYKVFEEDIEARVVQVAQQ